MDSINVTLQPPNIILINTAAGKAQGRPGSVNTGCGMGREATLYLREQGIRLTGTDGWRADARFAHTARRFAKTGDVALIWQGHRAGGEIGYCRLEKLADLDSLPAAGFMVSCFPPKVRGGSAGWTRVVADVVRQWRQVLQVCGVALDEARCFTLIVDKHQIHPRQV